MLYLKKVPKKKNGIETNRNKYKPNGKSLHVLIYVGKKKVVASLSLHWLADPCLTRLVGSHQSFGYRKYLFLVTQLQAFTVYDPYLETWHPSDMTAKNFQPG